MDKQTARERIVSAANAARSVPERLHMRHLQIAVAIVRHQGLVKPEVLEAAKFNAKRRTA